MIVLNLLINKYKNEDLFMKLEDITETADGNKENKTLYTTKAPGDTGELITSAQAARLLGVSQSRIRQMIGDGDLQSVPPSKGQRDHLLKLADVKSHKSKMKEPGRPAKNDN